MEVSAHACMARRDAADPPALQATLKWVMHAKPVEVPAAVAMVIF